MRIYDENDAAELNAEPWQIDLLNLNPSYVCWGPHEDYMWKENEGWDGRVINETWTAFGPWALDSCNECVNFYFSVIRDSMDCPSCGGNGYHPDAQEGVNRLISTGQGLTPLDLGSGSVSPPNPTSYIQMRTNLDASTKVGDPAFSTPVNV